MAAPSSDSADRSAQRRVSGHLIGTWVAVLVALAGIVATAYYLTGGFGLGLGDRDLLRDKLQAEHTADIHPREDTEALCGEKHCTVGWRTDVGNFLQFDREGQAEYWQTVLGDQSRRNGKVLLDMTGYHNDLEQQKRAVDTLFSEKDWS